MMTRDPGAMSETELAAWAAVWGQTPGVASRPLFSLLLRLLVPAASCYSRHRLHLVSRARSASWLAPMRPMASPFAVSSANARISHTRGGRTGATIAGPVTKLGTAWILISSRGRDVYRVIGLQKASLYEKFLSAGCLRLQAL